MDQIKLQLQIVIKDEERCQWKSSQKSTIFRRVFQVEQNKESAMSATVPQRDEVLQVCPTDLMEQRTSLYLLFNCNYLHRVDKISLVATHQIETKIIFIAKQSEQ